MKNDMKKIEKRIKEHARANGVPDAPVTTYNVNDPKKICKGCGQEKLVENFYRHPAFADGRDNRCKECRAKKQREAYSRKRGKRNKEIYDGGNVEQKEPPQTFGEPIRVPPPPELLRTGYATVLDAKPGQTLEITIRIKVLE